MELGRYSFSNIKIMISTITISTFKSGTAERMLKILTSNFPVTLLTRLIILHNLILFHFVSQIVNFLFIIE